MARNLVFKPTPGVIRALSGNLYKNPLKAVAELVINGLDAANRRLVKPAIRVDFWKMGSHPLSGGPLSLSVTDNGCGFTDEIMRVYGMIGESARIGHGRHGVGKLAPFALTDQGQYHIVTATDNGPSRLFSVDMETMLGGKGFTATQFQRKGDYGMQPGPFTQIFVPNMTAKIDPERLRQELTYLLPLTEWSVTVNSRPVEPLRFTSELDFTTTEPVPGVNAPVRFRLARYEGDVAKKPHGIWLADMTSGRLVTELDEQPRGVLNDFDRVLFHPALIGIVFFPNIEDWSSADRSGLRAQFWDGEYGIGVMGALNTYGVEAAKELLKEEPHEKKNPILECMMAIKSQLEGVFGAPDKVRDSDTAPDHTGEEEGDTKDPSRGDRGEGEDTGEGGGKPSGGSRGPRRRHTRVSPHSVRLRIEDETYDVMSFPSPGMTVPAQVRKGGSMVINTTHHAVAHAIASKDSRQRFWEMAAFLCQAHVEATRDPDDDKAGEAWTIHRRLMG